MPMYRYRCLNESCGDEFEKLIRAGNAPYCPKCNGVKLEKLITLPAANRRSFFGVGDNVSGFSSFENQVIDQAKKDVKPHIDAGG